MGREIERKFLVKGDFKSSAKQHFRIAQGYLSSVPERTVRIRLKDGKGYLTIKGISDDSGLSRFEWETEITTKDASDMLQLCETGLIDKTRYIVNFENQIFEIDEFHGKNEGLVIAELELTNENDKFTLPEWIGEEVTGNIKYYNAYISQNPYKSWEENSK